MSEVVFIVSTPAQLDTFKAVVPQLPDRVGYLFLSVGSGEKMQRDRSFPCALLKEFPTYNICKILRNLGARLVVVGNDTNPLEEICIEAAKNEQIPTLLVQDGLMDVLDVASPVLSAKGPTKIFFNKLLRAWRELFKIRQIYMLASVKSGRFLKNMAEKAVTLKTFGENGCDAVAVTGYDDREKLIAKGLNEKTIRVTGQPRFDGLFETKVKEPGEGFLILTQPHFEDGVWDRVKRNFFLEMLATVTRTFSEENIVVKPHPREDAQTYDLLTGPKVVVKARADVHSLMSKAEVIFTVCSTTLVEALFLGKPVVMLDFFGENTHRSFVTQAAVVYVSDTQDLEGAVMQLREAEFRADHERKIASYMEKHYGKLDGRASSRVAELIKEMLKDN